MPSSRERVVAVARSWVDTPFIHYQMAKGVGVDCWHLIRAVGEEAEVLEPIGAEAWAPFSNYPRMPTPEFVRAGLDTFLVPLSGEPQIGDIALMEARPGRATHMAILTERQGRAYIIHAHAGQMGKVRRSGRPAARVVEHGFLPPWGRRQVVAWYSYPGLVEVSPDG